MHSKLNILLAVTGVNLLVIVLLMIMFMGDDAPAVTYDSGPGGDLLQVKHQPGDAGGSELSNGAAVDKEFRTRIQPFLAQHCYKCHGEKKQKADMSLHKFNGQLSMQKQRKLWLTAAKMLRTSEMPPGKSDQPDFDERIYVADWIVKTLNDIDCENPDPGRVTIRRLNKVEYNNTIRDLVGVDFNPADDFPDDDVGYGFDNIGDVLSMPPVLLEKYLAAAREIAARAIEADPGRGSTSIVYNAGQLKGGVQRSDYTYLTSSGEIYIDHTFTDSGTYELRLTAFESRGGDGHLEMGLRVDGKHLRDFEVKATRTKPGVYKIRTAIKKGRRRIAVRFNNDFYDPNFKDQSRRDRNMYVNQFEFLSLAPQPTDAKQLKIITTRPKDKNDWPRAGREVMTKLARRAYRRPVQKTDIDKLLRFVDMAKTDGASFDQSIELAVTAMLVSPHFLFRIEQDPPPLAADSKDKFNVRKLSAHELAVRLSYFLWSSMPDAELFTLADRGELRKPAVVQQQVVRMLEDPKAQALVNNFAGQWLHLRSLERMSPDPKRFPGYTGKLKRAMQTETEMFFASVMRENRSILDFIDGRFTFVNEQLAKHYGLKKIDGKPVSGEQFQRVSLDGKQRSGILTQASLLTITSNPTRTNPALRGKYVLEEILGTPPPPPPADVPELEEGDQAELKGSLRQRMELHRNSPVCSSCHQRMDPIGFGFENYDAIGRWRTKDGKHTINAAGTLPGGEKFNGPSELKSILLQKKELFTRNLIERMLTYAMGRGLEYYDKCAVDQIVDAVESDKHRFGAMIAAIVQSDPFTKRRGPLRADEDIDD